MNPATDFPLLPLVFGISVALFDLLIRRFSVRTSLALAVAVGLVFASVTAMTLVRARDLL